MYKLHTFNLGFGEETNVILDNGNGKFVSFPQDPNNENYKAYALCEMNCTQAMMSGEAKVFIDNVFSLDWEIEPYIKLAKDYSYSLFVVTVEKMHDGENIHGVEMEQLQRMAEKYQVKLM